MWSDWKALALLILLFTLPLHSPALGQELDAQTLARLSRNAGYIFSGTVLSVERMTPADTRSVATMQVRFRVDHALLGVRTGEVFTIREWAGLWESGERYRPGERLVLFLYPSSKLGLTSPVGGSQGRFAVDGRDDIVLNPPGRGTTGQGAAAGSPRKGGTRISRGEFVRAIRRAQEQ